MSSRHHEMTEPGPVLLGLVELVYTLTSVGIDVPMGERFQDRALGMPELAEPKMPASLLECTDDELLEYMRETAIYRAGMKLSRDVDGDLNRLFAEQFAANIRAHADQMVEQMRPDFDAGVQQAKELRALGITERDTPDTIVQLDAKAIVAWQEFAARAPYLDQLAEARIDLSRFALVAPTRSKLQAGPIEWGVCFNVEQFDRLGEAAWQRWLRIAPAAVLVPPSEITQMSQLEHKGIVKPELLAAIAQDRFNTGKE